jgi:DNA-binding response OmpR family regulator
MPKKILIVEDEEILLDLLNKKLKNQGYNVIVARDGEEGLRLMKEERPDLVLLDIVMPKLDGFEVMEEMQKDDKLRNIPVVIVSNSGQPVEIEKAKELGAKDWLIKTEFDPQEVIEKVINQIGQ